MNEQKLYVTLFLSGETQLAYYALTPGEATDYETLKK